MLYSLTFYFVSSINKLLNNNLFLLKSEKLSKSRDFGIKCNSIYCPQNAKCMRVLEAMCKRLLLWFDIRVRFGVRSTKIRYRKGVHAQALTLRGDELIGVVVVFNLASTPTKLLLESSVFVQNIFSDIQRGNAYNGIVVTKKALFLKKGISGREANLYF